MKGLILFFVCAFWATATNAATIHVPGDQPTIQAGIDAANPWDTVLVAVGTYVENPVIGKPIHLIGEDETSTIIDGSNVGDVVLVTASDVTVKNFCIIHGGGNQPFEDAWDAGIKIIQADSCVIEFCRLRDNGAAGVAMTASSYNRIANCQFYNNVIGIYFYESDSGPYIANLGNNMRKNQIWSNSHCGIRFVHTLATHHTSNLIRGNLIKDNGYGISMIMSEQNEVSYNNLNDNSGAGIGLFMCMGGGQGNEFHHNCFLNNGSGSDQAYDMGEGIDYWYSQFMQEGNYWDDYVGSDTNGDGIGDTPYDIGGDESQDIYPLMEPEDSDGDSIIDSVDNCADTANPGQEDTDGDGLGDACDMCCNHDGIRGDADYNMAINVADLTYLVDYLFFGGDIPPCPEEGNVDADGGINVADVTYLVEYTFFAGPPPPPCP